LEENVVKIFQNIAGLYAIAKPMFALGEYKKNIEHFKSQGDKVEERKAIKAACVAWTTSIINYLNLTIDIENPENLPTEGPIVYVANHQSYSDILVLLNVVKHQTGFIAKEELKKIPVFSGWIRRIRSLFISRGDARASLKTINEGAELVREGFSLIIFPEGTRSRGNEMAEFKHGSLKLATKAKATVVPITLKGTYKLFEEHGVVTKNVTVGVVVHEPIDTANLDRHAQNELAEHIEQIVRSGLE
jgi:1-acyl-sn-glycerol-3-phosphate acyltransferase